MAFRDRDTDFKWEMGLLFCVVVWGINFPVLKVALAVMPTHVVNSIRFTFSALVLGSLYGISRRARKSSYTPLPGKLLVRVFALGLLGFVIYQLCFILGLDRTTSGSAALIMAGAPVWTSVVGRFAGFDRISMGATAGLALTVVGTAVVVIGGPAQIDLGREVLVGNVIMVFASFFWGAYTALTKPLLSHVRALDLTFLGLIVSLPILYALAVPLFGDVDWRAVTPIIWLALIVSGSLSTGVCVVLWALAVREVGASHTAAFGNLVPVIALATSWLILSESVGTPQLAGGSLVLGGLYIMRRQRRADKRRSTTTPDLSSAPRVDGM